MRIREFQSACFLTVSLSLANAACAEETACSAHSGATVPSVVELYTSEGCSSCPPADRWFSQLKFETGVIGLAFHVDYWDSLGWKDRFASNVFTARQGQLQKSNGAGYSYTPQIVLNGEDYPRWRERRLPLSVRIAAPSTVEVSVVRTGSSYEANVLAVHDAPEQLEAFWAMTEDDFSTSVRAGENRGATLKHDLVVREYSPIARWPANSKRQFTFTPQTPEDRSHRRLVDLVILDAKTGRPVQAVKVGC
jgi:hypothetical protein